MGSTSSSKSIQYSSRDVRSGHRNSCLWVNFRIENIIAQKLNTDYIDVGINKMIEVAEKNEEEKRHILIALQDILVKNSYDARKCKRDQLKCIVCKCSWCKYKSVHNEIFQSWKNVILIARDKGKLNKFLCIEERSISENSHHSIINEAQGFCYLASNLLRYMQVKRYVETVETSKIKKDYEDILSYSQRSTDLLYATFLTELSIYSTEEIKEKDPILVRAIGLYLLGLNHQIIAYSCLFDLTKNARFLKLAYDVSCLLKVANAKDLEIRVSKMSLETLKKRLRYRAIAYANVESVNEDDLRKLLIENHDPYEFALRMMLDIDDTPSIVQYTRNCSPLHGNLKASSKIKVARCETPVSSENDIITFFWSQGRLIHRDLSNRHVCQTCFQCFLEQDFRVHVATQHDG
jgi:hypothetical protein